jgi:fatty-acyl-CoA synthase
VTSWADLVGRAGSIASTLRWHGIQPGAKVAHYLRNGPAYIESSFACFLACLVHVNVNFRYGPEELYYLFDNSDTEVIIYDEEFAPNIAAIRPRLDKVSLFIEVTRGTPPEETESYETIAASELVSTYPTRSGDDLLFIYTGGTTGLPKGVMWDHANLWAVLGGGACTPRGPHLETLDELEANILAKRGYEASLICPPLMHGSGYTKAIYTLLMGGTIALLGGASFDADQAFKLIERHRLTSMVIVGDAFGRPLLRALNSTPGAYDLTSLATITSGGAVLSQDVKDGLLRHCPSVTIVDAFGSSESIVIGMNISRRGGKPSSAEFKHNRLTQVLDEDGNPVVPGSGQIGRVARTGPLPIGYYKDPQKTEQTFTTVNGQRYVFPGDLAKVNADGSILLLGRGNMCINTGGEKVFPEEVEESLKSHPSVDDALVFGIGDEKWGQAVTALVELAKPVDIVQLRSHLKSSLAGFKVPKHILFISKVPRTPSGKPDYEAAKRMAEENPLATI